MGGGVNERMWDVGRRLWREDGAEQGSHPSDVIIHMDAPTSVATSQFLHALISYMLLIHLSKPPPGSDPGLIITRNCSNYEITESNIPLSDMISFPYGLFAQAGSLPLFYKLTEEPLALPVSSPLLILPKFQVHHEIPPLPCLSRPSCLPG